MGLGQAALRSVCGGSRKEECETGFPSSDTVGKKNNIEEISPFDTKVKAAVSLVLGAKSAGLNRESVALLKVLRVQ